MSRTTGIIVLVIVIALIGAAIWFLAAPPGAGPGSTSTTTGTQVAAQTYTNAQYGYSFQYPGTLTVQTLAPEAVLVGTTTAQGFSPSVEVALARSDQTGTSTSHASYDAYVASLGHLLCAANGAGISVDCPSVARQSAFTSQSGLSGETLYFNLVRTTLSDHSTATSTFGPVYAFNAGANLASSSAKFAALLVYQPLGTYVVQQDEADVTAVANSLQLNRTQ